jgi:UDP-glucose 4-epimerase
MTPPTDPRPAVVARPRCLVLGGGGFLGGHIVELLQAEGFPVRVFDRVPRRAAAAPVRPDTEWHEGDFGNRGDLAAAVKGCQIAVHLVATTLPRTSNEDPVHDLESNLLPTIRFLHLALEQGVRRIVFASSGGTVYGVPRTVPVPEEHPTQPLCSYGIHKLAIEQFLHLYHALHGLEYCVLRLANPFGERQRSDASQGAVAVFLDHALRGEPVTVWGDGSAVRDYVYVGDVAEAFHRAVVRDAPTGLFNIGSGQGQSVNDLLEAIEALLGRPVARRYVDGRAFDVPVNVLDISRAARVLDWQPRVGFRRGLERTLAWRQGREEAPGGSSAPGAAR